MYIDEIRILYVPNNFPGKVFEYKYNCLSVVQDTPISSSFSKKYPIGLPFSVYNDKEIKPCSPAFNIKSSVSITNVVGSSLFSSCGSSIKLILISFVWPFNVSVNLQLLSVFILK